MITIWFNHWFSTVYRFIELIREGCQENNIPIKIIGTNKVSSCVYQNVCDEFYLEPNDLFGKDYVEWCLDFCKKNKIDCFFVKHQRIEIAKEIKKFQEANIKVLVDDNYELLEMLEDKYKTALFFNEHGICDIPEIKVVNTAKEFEKAYDEIRKSNPLDRICAKFSIDEGANSFTIITNKKEPSIDELKFKNATKMTYSQILSILESVDRFDDLILMPFLEGPEISIDSLMTKNGFVAISRSKIGTRATLVEDNKAFYNISRKFAEISKIKRPYNIQLRKHKDKWYLLEVNTRMAGGTYKSSAIGINIPFLAFCDLMNIDCKIPTPEKKSVLVSHVETSIILKNQEV